VRIWSFPNRVLFGDGATAELGNELERLGAGRALVVTDRASLDAGLVEHVGLSLRRGKVSYEVFAGVSPIAKIGEVDDALAAYRDAEADAVVGIGAPGPLEAAKLLRLLFRGDHRAQDVVEIDKETPGGSSPRVPFLRVGKAVPVGVAIPSWGGTGAEVRARVELVDGSGHTAIVDGGELRPDLAVLDPGIATLANDDERRNGAFGALSRAVEGLCVAAGHPMAELLAEGAIARVAAAWAPGNGDGSPDATGEADEAAVEATRAERLLEASVLAGLAADAGEGPCRSLGRALAMVADVPPGLGDALCLPAVLDFNRSAVPERLAQVARILGARGDDVDTLAFEAAGSVRALRRRAGVPESLGDAEVGRERFGDVADRALEDLKRFGHPPRPCDRDDLVALLKASE